jgi:hypothetical protein
VGEARRKRERFLSLHPDCCFCGGITPATTLDHVPPRVCFAGRHAPDSFQFPACPGCQNATRIDELVFGFFVRMADTDDENFRQGEFERLLSGIKNNAPHALPRLNLSRGQLRRSLREMGIPKPPGILVEELPLAAISIDVHPHILRYARKLALALYYREQERIAAPGHHVWAMWCQATDRKRMNAFEDFVKMTPLVTVGERKNVNFGNQFAYRCNKADKPDVFAAIAQFGLGIVTAMIVVDAPSANHLKWRDSVQVQDLWSH